MAVTWTEEQSQVIGSRGEDLLVSAAAGSGKTAVLIQHVIDRVLDPVDPISVQELLIVTFTKAAAAEMKDRLRKKLDEIQREEPDNMYVRRQASLVDQAHISTLDSFCSWLVKNYFHVLDIDPDFRIMDETEGKLLREDVMAEFMEEMYAAGDPAFLHLADAFATAKSDQGIRDMILDICRKADSMPHPERWLIGLSEEVIRHTSMNDFAWSDRMFTEIRDSIRDWEDVIVRARDLCRALEWTKKLEDMFDKDVNMLQGLLAQKDLDHLLEAFSSFKLVNKAKIPDKDVQNRRLYEGLRELRDALKDGMNDLKKAYATVDTYVTAGIISESMEDCRSAALLASEYRRRYQRAKAEKNLAEFNDVAHWALDIVLEEAAGRDVPSRTALDLGREFREIIVDEYQDSNMIQELLLWALSGVHRGEPNTFMVGDVKQSIYKFRMARPDLFMKKYDGFSYDAHSGHGRKIDLAKNFRSRASVLDGVNEIFEGIMTREYGGITYDDHAKLYYGAGSYQGRDSMPEMIVIDNSDREASQQELEGRVIAAKIKEMMDPEHPFMVYDSRLDEMRPVTYRDMVILLRSTEGWAEEIRFALEQEGIPAYAEQKKGYFDAPEIHVLMNFLRLLDNPRQDIPLVSVMRSPLGGFTDAELATLGSLQMGEEAEKDFYHRCVIGAEMGIASDKWNRLYTLIERWRKRSVTMSIDRLLEELLDETGYGLILKASVDGAVCMANVEMLMEQARNYEETIYHGIFDFLRYMEKVKSYNMDYGEASVLSDEEDLVRITTIHKSKGLEYPVVFVGAMGKKINLQDSRDAFLLDETMGICCDLLDPAARTKIRLPHKKMLSRQITKESKQEEMRILYVAMTRAREKLICIGTKGPLSKPEGKAGLGVTWRLFCQLEESESTQLPAVLIDSCTSYMDWIAMTSMMRVDPKWSFEEIDVQRIMEREALRVGMEDLLHEKWQTGGFTERPTAKVSEAWKRAYGWSYPWSESVRSRSVMSVSELKHLAMESYVEQHVEEAERTEESHKNFLSGNNMGAVRGTAYHKVLEKLSAVGASDPAVVRAGLNAMCEQGILDREQRLVVDVNKVAAFYQSPLGVRMAAAERRGELFREQPFVMGVDPENVWEPMKENGEYQLVQGIIDAFLIEENEIVLWDYKTDRIPAGRDPADYLTGMYRTQLLHYRNALERALGIKVKEIWIYSFAADRLIPITEEEEDDAL